FMTANISSAVACSKFWMISSVIGSLDMSLMTFFSGREMDVDVAVAVDFDAVAGVDDDGGAGILDDRRAVIRHARFVLRPIVDRGLLLALQRVVAVAVALQRVL